MRLGGLWPKGLVWLLGALALVPLGAVNAVPLLGQTTGNGAPSGAHYNLNIIGVPKTKDAPMDANNGHRIFVHLGSKKDQITVTTRIYLVQSTDGTFQVLDANGTDDSRAEFQLPAPGSYTIWARPLGGPGGKAEMTTCAEYTDPETDETVEVCSTDSEVFVREKGMRKFANVTTELTTIVLDEGSEIALACESTQVSLFDTCLEGYFWNYDNTGLKLLQLRFYHNGD
jgi:hypothetical protein